MSETKTYRLERLSDLLDLDDRQFEACMEELPQMLRVTRATRQLLRTLAEANGLPDPLPTGHDHMPRVEWVDDGRQDVDINISDEASIVLRNPPEKPDS